MTEKYMLPPNPSRLIEGLRDTGYEFNTALADILDNSVDAGASTVDIKIDMDADGEVFVCVIDDGCGMDRDTMLVAMTYGAQSTKKSANRLGKFGLGLKTASTAFCRRLSVISRGSIGVEPLKMVWDLDHVAKINEWELLIEKSTPYEVTLLGEIASENTGTLVIWEKVDRLLQQGYKKPGGAPARKALNTLRNEFKDHVEMVYQRFLDSTDSRARNIKIKINGEELRAWDPFCRNLESSDIVADETHIAEINDTEAEFSIKAYVLPRKEQFPSEREAKIARLNNDMQGIYVYRENRLIRPHHWFGMYSKEPHYSLLRVEFSFDHRLDAAFHVDIKKSEIRLNSELYDWIRDTFLPAPRNAANERYRKGERRKAHEKSEDAHTDSNSNIHSKEKNVQSAEISIINEETNDVEIINSRGKVRLKLTLSTAAKPGEVHVQPVPSLDDNILWAPALIDGHHAVQINTGHPYYSKVYIPNHKSGVTIQGMDSLLWALAEAEHATIQEATKKHFSELRFMISKTLRVLVEDLPDPVIDEEA